MLNIALPDQVAAFVEEQAIAAGFNTANEYVYHLIVREQERLAEQRQVEALLLEGLESGSPIEMTTSQRFRNLFKETQSLPEISEITEDEIAAEIAAYRGGE